MKEDTLHVHLVDHSFDQTTLQNLNLNTLKYRKRYFFLFDDMLMEVRELKSGKYKFVHSYDLLHLKVHKYFEKGNNNNNNENVSKQKYIYYFFLIILF